MARKGQHKLTVDDFLCADCFRVHKTSEVAKGRVAGREVACECGRIFVRAQPVPASR